MLPSKNQSNPLSSALAEAQAMVDAAEEKAKKIIDEAILSGKEIKEAGYREGLRIGKETATKNAISIIKEHDSLRSNLEKEAANLTAKILEHVFLLKNTDIIDPIAELAKKLLQSIPIGGNIDLVFNPSNASSIEAIKEELQGFSKNTIFHFIQSEDCDASTLILKTDFGEIKVSLRDFFSEIAKQMKLTTSQ